MDSGNLSESGGSGESGEFGHHGDSFDFDELVYSCKYVSLGESEDYSDCGDSDHIILLIRQFCDSDFFLFW